MSCDEILTRLAEALTGPDRAPPPAVAAHLATCAACRAEADAMRATLRAVRSIAAEDAPPVAPPSFESVLARTRSPSRRARRGVLIALALIAGAAADRLLVASSHTSMQPARPVEAAPIASDALVRRELAARPGGLGASVAILAALRR